MLRRQLVRFVSLCCLMACASCGSSEDEEREASAGGSSGAGGQPKPDASPEGQAESDAATEPAQAVPVEFDDGNLEQCVRDALQKPDETLFPSTIAELANLECQDMSIVSLSGLEHATGLTDLSLWENDIGNIEPLAGLTQLRDLQLGNNQVKDLTPLSGLGGLRRLGLSVNQVDSLEPLAGLTQLEWLNLDRNAIGEGELVHLAKLSSLRWLTIEHNGIQDHSALQPLVDSGCELYDHRRKSLGSFEPLSAVSSPTPRVDLSRLRMGFENGRVAMRYELDGAAIPVRQIGPSLTRVADKLVMGAGDRGVEVGSVVHEKPVLCSGELAQVCQVRVGVKWPEVGERLPGTGVHPIVTVSVDLIDPPKMQVRSGDGWAAADQDLVPYVLASPNQMDAGSCLFMSNTGAMEILMNQHTPLDQVSYGGTTDLSERYLMAAYNHVKTTVLPYFLTDLVFVYETLGGSLLNADYPFCAGYVKDNSSGSVSIAQPTDEGAYLSLYYNWFDMMPSDWQSMLVSTPSADRTAIFVDPKRDKNSQWRVALFDDDVVERIKYELRTKNAPVIVIYNHYLYWHANIVVGYDDTLDSNGCPMVEDMVGYFKEKGAGSYASAVEAHMAQHGGCSQHGVFYVRDSIYDGGAEEPMYDYSTSEVSVQPYKYSRRITKLSYNWAKYLGNHAYSMHRR